jgi:hypothetical protein
MTKVLAVTPDDTMLLLLVVYAASVSKGGCWRLVTRLLVVMVGCR